MLRRWILAVAAVLLAVPACAQLPGGQAAAPTPRSIRAADLRSFTYHGACGYEPVRHDVRFRDARQVAPPPVDEPPYPSSRARITGVRYVRIDGVPAEAALVQMLCTAGNSGVAATHLVVPTPGAPRDTGPVLFADGAASIPASVEHGRVVATEPYLRDTDPRCCASGRRTSRVGMGGGVPQRLAPGVGPVETTAGGTPRGVVTVAIEHEFGADFDSGVLIDRRHVAITSDVFRSGCPEPTRVSTGRGTWIPTTGIAYDARHGLMLLTLARDHPDPPVAVSPRAPAAGTRLLLWQSSGLAPDVGRVAGGPAADARRHRGDLVAVRAPGVTRDAVLPLAYTQIATDAAGRAIAIVDREDDAAGDALLATPLRYAPALRTAPPADFSSC